MRYLILLSLLFCGVQTPPTALGITSVKKKKERLLPRLSPKGYRRLKKNLSTIDENLDAIKKNIEIVDKNIGILEAEIANLKKFTQENKDLANSYYKYLKKADQESRKNNAATRKLLTWRKRITASVNNNNPESRTALARSEQELENRRNWDRDAELKKQQARRLLSKLKENEAQIVAKKNALRVEQKLWRKRGNNYRKLLAELQDSRADYQKILNRSPYF